MSGTQKPHFAIDLNEIERQLAQAQSGMPTPSSGGRHDPLADLARIGGQSDPFASLLSNEPERGRAQAEHDQLFAVRSEPAHDPYAHHRESAARSFEDEFRQEVERDQESRDYRQPVSAGSDGYEQQGYPETGYTQGYYEEQDEPQDRAYENAAYQREPSRGRSRKSILAFGALLGVLAVGSAGAFMFGGESTSVSTSEPPLIKATKEPIKVAPQNPGGVEIPNQNKQIYERAQSGETKVVTNSEQPVDVKQTVRMNGGSVSSTGSAAPVQPAANGLNLGEPRKVRTITIKPNEPAPAQVAEARSPMPAMPAMTMPVASPPAAAAPAAPPAASAAPVAAAPAPKPAPVAAAQTPTAPQKVAAVEPATPPATPAATDASSDAIGGFSVQLAVRGTEKDAQAAFSQFQKKFSELAGQAPLIRKAEVNGNTIFRVRAGPMSRDDASALCSSVQGQGGQCFVAKN